MGWLRTFKEIMTVSALLTTVSGCGDLLEKGYEDAGKSAVRRNPDFLIDTNYNLTKPYTDQKSSGRCSIDQTNVMHCDGQDPVENIKTVSCSERTCIAVDLDGMLWGTGWNDFNQLPVKYDHSSVNSYYPKWIKGWFDADFVFAGNYHTCISKNSQVECFGKNDNGQIPLFGSERSSVPRAAVYGSPAIALSDKSTIIVYEGQAYRSDKNLGWIETSFPNQGDSGVFYLYQKEGKVCSKFGLEGYMIESCMY